MTDRFYSAKRACFIPMLVGILPAFGGDRAAESAQQVIYVNAAAPGGGNGKRWASAFNSLSEALEAAERGDSIWVGSGTYYPTTDENRDASFTLKKGVSVYGGFQGSETQLSERDWGRNRTVLSGDIGKKGAADDNVCHVVRGADEAVLDGFVITGGCCMLDRMPQGGGPPAGRGFMGGPGGRRPPQGPGLAGGPGRGPARPPGPMGAAGGRAIHTSPQEILSGAGAGAGAGMINYQAAPTVRNCVFENNRGGKGGAVYNMTSAVFPPRPDPNAKVPIFVGCVFRNNYARGRGGGVSNDMGTSPVFLNCLFENNETPQKGGGMYNDFGCSPILINCLFTGNQAESAAAMGNDGGSSPVIVQCTFTKNHAADTGPALYQGTGPANNPAVLRCVIWGNACDWEGVGLYNWHDNAPRVEGSVIEGGYAGASQADPHLNELGVALVEAGYKPGDPRFTESNLPSLASVLNRERAKPPIEPAGPDRPPAAAKAAIPSSDRVVYVNGSRADAGDGRSWATAYSSLQAALEDAGRDGAEIRVAAGVYKPSVSDRSSSFVLRPGVKLLGGFTSDGGERNWETHATVLSGEIGAPDKREDNSCHVVIGADGAMLDGFTISGGFADGAGYDGKGGGMINYRRGEQMRPNLPTISGYSPEARNCIFAGNYARDGGAVYNYDRGKPKFVNCVFRDNSAENGGAVLDRVGVEASYEGCEFRANTARWRGGAAYFDYGSRPNLTGCVFKDNAVSGHGGAIFSLSRASQLENTALSLARCRFENNQAKGNGGAAALHDSALAAIHDSSFAANKAGQCGGAVAVTSGSALETEGNTFSGNSAGMSGADVYNDQSGESGGQGGRRPPRRPS